MMLALRHTLSRSLSAVALLTYATACGLAFSGCSRSGLSVLGSSIGMAGDDGAAGAVNVDPRCGPDSNRVYVLSSDAEMFVFDPDAFTIERLGPVDCGVSLNSMSISRDSVAHVSSVDGALFTVALDSLLCTPTSFRPDQLLGDRYGMGYVATANAPDEQLYIAEIGGFGAGQSLRLSVIELPFFELRPVAAFDPPIGAMELTGTGDGRLYGFVAETSPRLVSVDPQTAFVTDITSLAAFSDVAAFDFAFWGGDFYFFASSGSALGSRVVRLDLATLGTVDLGELDARIVGAGVSTCADPDR